MSTADNILFTTPVPLPLAAKVDALAARLARTRGSIVEEALATWVTQEEEFDRLTWEAMADVDDGNLIAHETVEAWVDGLAQAHFN